MTLDTAKRLGRLIAAAVATATALVAIAVVGFLVVAPRVLGGMTLTVLSGSMEPTIATDSVVLIRPVADPLAIEPGTVITFQNSPTLRSLTTHRVVSFHGDTTPPTYTTKGDANAGADVDPVPVGAIRGEVVAHVPHLGRWRDLLLDRRTLAIGAVALGIGFLIGRVRALVRAVRADASGDVASADAPAGPVAAGPIATSSVVPMATVAAVLIAPSNGRVVVATDGSVTYTPAPGFHGGDAFSYRATDPLAGDRVVTIAVTVAPAVEPRPVVEPVAPVSTLPVPYEPVLDVDALIESLRHDTAASHA